MRQSTPLHAEFEKIVASGRQSFYWAHASGRQFLAPYHYHPEYEIMHVRDGHGRRLVGNSIVHFGPGDLVFLGPQVPHVWMSAPDSTRSEAIYVQFLPDFLGAEFFERPEMKSVRELMDLSLRGVVFGPAVRKDVIGQLEKFDSLNETERLLALLNILVRMSRDSAARPLGRGVPQARLNRGHEQRIDRVFQHLNQKLTEPISQAEVARSVGMSPATFSRLFRRTTGKCFMEVVNEMRIGQVCQRLTESSQTVAEIAFGCGYETLSHFNRQFRRFMKMTPRRYRHRLRGLEGRKLE
jgi:AraC-like DNA-binding protein